MQIGDDQPSGLVPALHQQNAEERVAHGFEHIRSIGARRKLCRSGVAVDCPGAVGGSSVNRQVEGQCQLVHEVEDEGFAVGQTQQAGIVQDRVLRQEIHSVVVVQLADPAQVAIARQHLVTARRRPLIVEGVVLAMRNCSGHGDLPGFDDKPPLPHRSGATIRSYVRRLIRGIGRSDNQQVRSALSCDVHRLLRQISRRIVTSHGPVERPCHPAPGIVARPDPEPF